MCTGDDGFGYYSMIKEVTLYSNDVYSGKNGHAPEVRYSGRFR